VCGLRANKRASVFRENANRRSQQREGNDGKHGRVEVRAAGSGGGGGGGSFGDSVRRMDGGEGGTSSWLLAGRHMRREASWAWPMAPPSVIWSISQKKKEILSSFLPRNHVSVTSQRIFPRERACVAERACFEGRKNGSPAGWPATLLLFWLVPPATAAAGDGREEERVKGRCASNDRWKKRESSCSPSLTTIIEAFKERQVCWREREELRPGREGRPNRRSHVEESPSPAGSPSRLAHAYYSYKTPRGEGVEGMKSPPAKMLAGKIFSR